MKNFISKIFTILLSLTLCFSLVCCVNDNGNGDGGNGDGGNGGNNGNPPPDSGLITTTQLQGKVDEIESQATLCLDAGNFGVLTFKVGSDSGQTLNGKPLYKRELNVVTIEGKLNGNSKTTFLKTFEFETNKQFSGQDVAVKTTIKTLKFKNLSFKENIKLIFNYASSEVCPVIIENLVFENVEINNYEMPNVNGRHGIAIETNCGAIKNLTFTNSKIINVNSPNASGIHFNDAGGVEKITVENSVISGVNYNAIQVNKFSGELSITNSNISFTGNRAIRIDDVKANSKIVIKSNAFSGLSGNQVFKISNVINPTEITVELNTLDGAELVEEDYSIS